MKERQLAIFIERIYNMKHNLLLILILTLSSCVNDDSVNLSPDLKGKWVEMETSIDTLTFEVWDTMDIMILDRGKEMRDGHLLPKAGSGSYQYRLVDGKISLYWMLSSNSSFKDYKFKLTGERLVIDDFYGPSSSVPLTFKKLE